MKTKRKNVTKAAPRQRRASRNRAPRSSYAVSRDGSSLWRFATVDHLRKVAKKEGLKPVTALQARALQIEGKATIIDTRSDQPSAGAAPLVAETGAPKIEVGGNTFTLEELTQAMAKALQVSFSRPAGRHAAIPMAGEQPQASRASENDH